jgi:allantoin racemase
VSGKDTFEKLLAAAKQLRYSDHADTIILGCAGMASYRAKLESAIEIPVISPVQATVSMAMHSLLTTQQYEKL